jgi:hypothetical protein
MRTTSVLMLTAGLIASPTLVAAQGGVSARMPPTPAGDESTEIWTGDIGVNGMRGAHRVDSGFPIRAGDLILMLGTEYSTANDLFATGDTNQRNSQYITAVWSPFTSFALSVRQSIVSNRNTAFTPTTTQNLGDPRIALKYAVPLDKLGVGAVVAVTLPTSAHGNGLSPNAYILDGYGAASYLATDFLSVSANVGYRLDKSNKIFKRDILAVQRFTAGISQENAILGGLGIETNFKLGDMMVLGPFAEFSAAVAKDGPMRATLGAKFSPFGMDNVELAVGADYAVAGVPKPPATATSAASKMAGIPPWEVFGAVAAHLGPKPKTTPTTAGPQLCTTDAECKDGQVCVDGFCGKIKEVIKEVVKEVEKPAPAFTIEGGVFDQTSGEPVGNAVVAFSGVAGSALAVDYKTGTFKSWAIPCGEGLIKVSVAAPGYRPYEETIPKGKVGEAKSLTLKIQNAGEAAMGEIKGVLKDAANGNPIKNGQIFIPILSQKIKSDVEGKFSAQLKAGRYQVLISGPKYITQKKEVEIRAGDVVIFNVDMTSKK